MSWAYVAVAAVTAVYTGYQTHETQKGYADQAQADANAQLARGRLEAERIRKEKEKTQSAARAALAQNGLDVNKGTSVVINDTIEQAANYDANMAETTGYNSSQRLQAEASTYRKNANAATVSTALNTASSSMNAYGSKGGWK